MIPEQNLVLLRGAVPGAIGGLVVIRKSVKQTKAQQQKAKEAIAMPSVPSSTQGEVAQTLELSAEVFGVDPAGAAPAPGGGEGVGRPPRGHPLHPRAQRRPGGGRKPWKQKGTGRARRARSARPSGRAAASRSAPGRASTTRRCRRDAARRAARGGGGQARGGRPPVVETLGCAEAKTKALTDAAEAASASTGSPRCWWWPSATAHRTRAARNVPWLGRAAGHTSVYQLIRNERRRVREAAALLSARRRALKA